MTYEDIEGRILWWCAKIIIVCGALAAVVGTAILLKKAVG